VNALREFMDSLELIDYYKLKKEGYFPLSAVIKQRYFCDQIYILEVTGNEVNAGYEEIQKNNSKYDDIEFITNKILLAEGVEGKSNIISDVLKKLNIEEKECPPSHSSGSGRILSILEARKVYLKARFTYEDLQIEEKKNQFEEWHRIFHQIHHILNRGNLSPCSFNMNYYDVLYRPVENEKYYKFPLLDTLDSISRRWEAIDSIPSDHLVLLINPEDEKEIIFKKIQRDFDLKKPLTITVKYRARITKHNVVRILISTIFGLPME
jgi:hypothetical protein